MSASPRPAAARHPSLPPHPTSAESMVAAGIGTWTRSPSLPLHPPQPSSHRSGPPIAAQLTPSQLDSEVHLLRMTVLEKDNIISKLQGELAYSHEELRRVNLLLQAKKEQILLYQERLADVPCELQGGQRFAPAPDPALQLQVTQLRHQVEQLTRERDQARVHRAAPAPDDRLMAHEVERLRRELRESGERLKAADARAGMLSHQVVTYREDFNSERRDRERTQSDLQKSLEETESLRKAITLLACENHIPLEGRIPPPLNP